MPGTGDEYVGAPVSPSIGAINIAQDEVVNLLQRPFGQGLVPLDERFHVVDGVAMPYRLKVLPEALAAYGDAVLQHRLGFAHGERVSLNGIGVVGEADAHVLPYLGNDIRGQGATGIEARLERIQLGKQFSFALHGFLWRTRFVYCGAKRAAGQET